jgi:hypothetical protein
MRKRTLFPVIAIAAFVCSAGCSSSNEADNLADTTYTREQMAHDYSIENLLGMKDEAALVAKYGKDAITYDTIWGAEGFFSMGTIIKTERYSHVEITWMSETTRTDIISVTLVSDQDWYADSINNGIWKSNRGITLGMPIEDLQKLNGHPFTFSGFGWDYAGSVLDWQKGNLDNKGIAVQLAEGPATVDLSPEESAQILGDVEVQSDNPLLKDFRPRVWAISVAKVQ